MNDNAHKVVVSMIAVVAVVWTLASLITLVYWSGLMLWVVVALAASAFAWTLRVYLRPTKLAEVKPPSA